ncbi:hypothetical protein AKJ41_00765 [candidate division MSBL1 archaeon SCGC-AAA259O05]|uniref:Uncharacterized protein n=1 Tax=candidate division MSBL1 archaeon SCGC-AAA259O05 TaxID=1698271 RepID=A0A133V5G5_9EURY|nr:hypothetical protein AKJ41_00765 [candidate division MSBL1 archaeon SCGC-AAA259O05]
MLGMTKGSWIAVLIFLTIAFMASLWMMDLSVSAMRVSLNSSSRIGLSNGFWTRNPAETYHMALWLAVASFFTTSIIAVKGLLGGER